MVVVGGGGDGGIVVLVMVTSVIRVEDIISSNVFSCSLYSSLPTTPSKPASSGGGDVRY